MAETRKGTCPRVPLIFSRHVSLCIILWCMCVCVCWGMGGIRVCSLRGRAVFVGEHDSAVLVSARSSTPGTDRLPIDPSLSISKAYAR